MQKFDSKFGNNGVVQRSVSYSLDLIKFLKTLDRHFVDEVIGKQLLRSGTSIGANIVEAQACSTRKDFTNFLHHALKSANESKYWLYLLSKSSDKSKQPKIDGLLQETVEIANILGKSLITLKK